MPQHKEQTRPADLKEYIEILERPSDKGEADEVIKR